MVISCLVKPSLYLYAYTQCALMPLHYYIDMPNYKVMNLNFYPYVLTHGTSPYDLNKKASFFKPMR